MTIRQAGHRLAADFVVAQDRRPGIDEDDSAFVRLAVGRRLSSRDIAATLRGATLPVAPASLRGDEGRNHEYRYNCDDNLSHGQPFRKLQDYSERAHAV
jgi:hypothetical protein